MFSRGATPGNVSKIYEVWSTYLLSETKAIGQELIYEAKLQNSAWPERP